MTHFRRRMRRLLDVIGGVIILGLWAIDCAVNPEMDDDTERLDRTRDIRCN